MKTYLNFTISLILLAAVFTGCSGGGGTLTEPGETGDPTSIREANNSERVLWGVWSVEFDPATKEINLAQTRNAPVHFDITGFLSPPECDDCLIIEILELNSAGKYIKLKLSLINKTPHTGYDVRGIIMPTSDALKLLNADAYTDLWDDGGVITINPFRAFATDQPLRAFTPDSGHARIYEIEYPSFSELIALTLVVDASWPNNCKEPYAIGDFHQEGNVVAAGGSTDVSLTVSDWQSDEEGVFIDATPIGGGLVELAPQLDNWGGAVDVAQYNDAGTYPLLVYAGSADTTLKLYNYVDFEIIPCKAEGNETWETATPLPVGGNCGEQVVCINDKNDWYKFTVSDHIYGELKLNIITDNGPCDVRLYSNPDGEYLAADTAEYDDDAVFDLGELDLAPGGYYIRIRHLGDNLDAREYVLYLNAVDSVCYPDGNDDYSSAIDIPWDTDSGAQYVCTDDKEDWFKFTFDGESEKAIWFRLVDSTGEADIFIYSHSQAPTPDGPNLYSDITASEKLIPLDDLSLDPGEYFIRVIHHGSDGFIRKYKVYYTPATIPCVPEGNEHPYSATSLPMGEDSGIQVVCLDDTVDYYGFSFGVGMYGEVRLVALNDTGMINLEIFDPHYPDNPPLLGVTATYGVDGVIPVESLDFHADTTYARLKVSFVGDDDLVRQYVLYNNTNIWPCSPEEWGNDIEHAYDLSVGGDTGLQDVCKYDQVDFWRFSYNKEYFGNIRLELLTDTGPVMLNFYPYEDQGPVYSEFVWYGEDGIIDVQTLGLNPDLLDKVYVSVEMVGYDYGNREFILYNELTDWPCLPDDSNDYATAIEIPDGGGTGDQFVCIYDWEDWFSFYYNGDVDEFLILEVSNDTEPVELTLYTPSQAPTPDGDNITQLQANPSASFKPSDFGLTAGTYYARVRFIGVPQEFCKFHLNYNMETGWAYVFGDNKYESGKKVKIDSEGNVYITGIFKSDFVDFDPGPDVSGESADGFSNIFICKYGPDYQYTWSKSIGSSKNFYLEDMDVDSWGNVYITGGFSGAIDFDPGPGIDMHSPLTDKLGAFVCKFNTDGAYQWTATFDCTDMAWGCGVGTDPSGNLLVTGFFNHDIDLDPGTGEDIQNPGIDDSAFVVKLDPDGNHIWGKSWGGDGEDLGKDVVTDNSGNCYIFGEFGKPTDFDPGPGVFILESYDSNQVDPYINALDSDGNFLWAIFWGRENCGFESNEIIFDGSGYLYVTGSCELDGYTFDLDPGPGEDWHYMERDLYFSKIDLSGNYIWGHTLGNPGSVVYEEGQDIAVYGSYVYLCGNTIGGDFDPGPGEDVIIAGSFLTKFNTDGTYLWSRSWSNGYTSEDYNIGNSVAITANGCPMVAGIASGDVDYDPGPGLFVDEGWGGDAYLIKFLPDGYWY